MWFEYKEKPTEPGYDPDRRVTLTVGQLTDAIAKALEVVEDAPPEPKWKRGDRAFVEVEVTGLQHEGAHVSVSTVDTKNKQSFDIPACALMEIRHAS